ncbi:UNVERIFIED_CONTAM: hypothetical protein NY603_31160, partial [Bacteroidetes bacterium 56_B9]
MGWQRAFAGAGNVLRPLAGAGSSGLLQPGSCGLLKLSVDDFAPVAPARQQAIGRIKGHVLEQVLKLAQACKIQCDA